MLLDNFLGGIVWSLGVWVGTTIVVAILVYFLAKVNLVAVVGEFMSDVSVYMAKDSPFLPF